MHLVVFGHSHVWSVRRAIAEGWSHPGVTAEVPVCGTKELPGPVIYLQPGTKPALNPVIIALLNKAQARPTASGTWAVSMVQGNFFNQLGMVTSARHFDFVLDSHPDLPLTPGATILPCAAVRRVLAQQMAEFQAYAPILARTAFHDRMILVGPPPPPRGEQEIAALLAADPKGTTQAALITPALITPALITPAFTRLKLWHLQNQLAAGYCAAARLQYLAGDLASYLAGDLSGVQDADGFILPDFIKDAVHANHTYAAILLHRLAQIATGQRGASHG